VHTLRTIDDALAIAAHLGPGAPIVVIGAGFIGAEVAASARTLGSEVTLLEVAPVPLERALGREVGEIYARIHRARGVDLRTGVTVERIEGAKRAERVVLADGTAFEASLVVLGVGIDPNVELARDAGIDCEDGILVDERGRTSAEAVFAGGDVARHPNPILGERIRVEHWQNAQTQAAVAAKSALGIEAVHREVPWFWSDQYDLNLQMVGHASRWDRIVYRGDPDSESFATFYLDDGRLVAALGVNRAKDVRGARALMEGGIPVGPDELADEGVDLRAHAKQARAS
jgi:3-phenylpropionate/trans-cinnamate dioxygenase ferredoxin reductase subunit